MSTRSQTGIGSSADGRPRVLDVRGRRVLVTGGAGFIGSALIRALVARGALVRSLDDNSRGGVARLADVADHVDLIVGDVRDEATVRCAVRGVDTVCHLAAVNGTATFYSDPERVLEVAIKGTLHVLDACRAEGVRDFVLASSSEVYQTAPVIPTPENVPLQVPDVLNPRFSYSGGKIASELLAINYGRRHFTRVSIVRPHNVYGPDMGTDHVVPQFVLRLRRAPTNRPGTPLAFPLQGTGRETRAFLYIDDCVDGLMRVIEQGEHLGIYNIGTTDETTIGEIAHRVAAFFDREIALVPGPTPEGSPQRRCPDISRIQALGFTPHTDLTVGLSRTVDWYRTCPLDQPHGAS